MEARLTHKERAARRKQIITEVARGATVGDVALKHDLATQTIRAMCREAYVFSPGEHRQEYLSVIAALLNTSDSISKIANDCNREVTAVAKIYRRCLAAGIRVRIRKRGRPCKTITMKEK